MIRSYAASRSTKALLWCYRPSIFRGVRHDLGLMRWYFSQHFSHFAFSSFLALAYAYCCRFAIYSRRFLNTHSSCDMLEHYYTRFILRMARSLIDCLFCYMSSLLCLFLLFHFRHYNYVDCVISTYCDIFTHSSRFILFRRYWQRTPARISARIRTAADTNMARYFSIIYRPHRSIFDWLRYVSTRAFRYFAAYWWAEFRADIRAVT